MASHAADALVGPSRSMSPAFVLALSSNQVVDPGFFVILLAFGSARDWLLRQPQQVCEQFYHIVATPGDGSCKGPATALCCYLAKVDWPMNKQGYLAASLFFQIHILIKRLLTQAWFNSDPLSIANLVACYHALGNQAANAHAIATCRDYNKPWQQDLGTRHNEQQLEKSRLKQIYGLHLALARARVQAETQLTADEKPGTSVGFRPHEIREKLICWRPSQPISYDTTLLRPDLVEHFSWGPRWARLFGQWLQQVSWDSQGTTALDTDVGITWLELALSLRMFTERWLPCVRPDDSGTEWVIFPCSNEETLAVGYLASDAAVTMWRMWTAYHSLLGTTSVII